MEGRDILSRGHERKCKDTRCVLQGWGIQEPGVVMVCGDQLKEGGREGCEAS